MKGEAQGGEVAPSPAAVISVLDRYAGIFRGHRARSAKVGAGFASERALNFGFARFRAADRCPLGLKRAPRPQDGRRAIKDGPCVGGEPGPRSPSNSISRAW